MVARSARPVKLRHECNGPGQLFVAVGVRGTLGAVPAQAAFGEG
jgi:hypothetical protein